MYKNHEKRVVLAIDFINSTISVIIFTKESKKLVKIKISAIWNVYRALKRPNQKCSNECLKENEIEVLKRHGFVLVKW